MLVIRHRDVTTTLPVGSTRQGKNGNPERCRETTKILAERRTPARRLAVQHIGHQNGWLNGAFVFGENERLTNQNVADGSVLNAVTEERDRATVIGLVGVGVQGRVQLRTGGEQSDHPDRKRRSQRHPVQQSFRFQMGVRARHGVDQSQLCREVKCPPAVPGPANFQPPEFRLFQSYRNSGRFGLLVAQSALLVTGVKTDQKGSAYT